MAEFPQQSEQQETKKLMDSSLLSTALIIMPNDGFSSINLVKKHSLI